MSAALLRVQTAAAHDAVDAAFGAFRLDSADGYRGFLLAHARARPAVEAALTGTPDIPAWRPRVALLAEDVADLGAPMPTPLPFTLPTPAHAWGALYVAEGSRLGGAMLAREVGPGLPRRYLSDAFVPGEWRSLRAAIDVQAERGGTEWIAQAVAGAEACFALYRKAAATTSLSASEPVPQSAR
jgi:heme oxygenase